MKAARPAAAPAEALPAPGTGHVVAAMCLLPALATLGAGPHLHLQLPRVVLAGQGQGLFVVAAGGWPVLPLPTVPAPGLPTPALVLAIPSPELPTGGAPGQRQGPNFPPQDRLPGSGA